MKTAIELPDDDEHRELARIEPAASGLAAASLFGTTDPREIVTRVSAIATVLADVVRQRELSKVIEKKEFVYAEGWTLLGSLLGVYPVVVECEPIPGTERECWNTAWKNGRKERTTSFVGHDWRSRVEARTLAGQLVGSGVAVCSRGETKWENDPEYAVCSMSETRAVSKALRLPLGFVMKLAGFQSTPAEEVPEGGFEKKGRGRAAAPAKDDGAAAAPVKDARGLCPKCWKRCVRADSDGGFYCWKKAGGCGQMWTGLEVLKADLARAKAEREVRPVESDPAPGISASGNTAFDREMAKQRERAVDIEAEEAAMDEAERRQADEGAPGDDELPF